MVMRPEFQILQKHGTLILNMPACSSIIFPDQRNNAYCNHHYYTLLHYFQHVHDILSCHMSMKSSLLCTEEQQAGPHRQM